MPQLHAKAVIFDLDGVLLDTEKLYSEATQRIVGRYGKTYTFDIKAQTMGRDARFGADLVLRTLKVPLSVDEYLAERQRLLLELFPASEPLPGAAAFVEALDARGFPLAIATSSSRQLASIKMHGKSWISRFRAIVYGDDPRVRALKPAPDIFLVAAEELDTPIVDCVIFEDSPAGIEAALRSGAQVVALPDPRLDEALSAGAHRVIRSYAEIKVDDLLPRSVERPGSSQGGVE